MNNTNSSEKFVKITNYSNMKNSLETKSEKCELYIKLCDIVLFSTDHGIYHACYKLPLENHVSKDIYSLNKFEIVNCDDIFS
jgi:hypothetical protein